MPWTSGLPRTYGPGLRYGQGIRDASTFSGRSSSWVTRPLGQRRRVTGRTGSQTSRSRARSRAGCQHPGQHQGVVERVVRPLLGHAPVRGQRLQPQIVDAQVQPPGQLDGAHDGVDGQFGFGDLGLRGQERVVERDVVRHQRAAAQQLDHVTDDVGELRLVFEHRGGQAVHVGGTRVHAGIEQADHGLLDSTVGVEAQCGEADDPGLTWPEARGLDVDDGPAPVRLAGRPAPGLRFHGVMGLMDSGWHVGPTSPGRCASCRHLNR